MPASRPNFAKSGHRLACGPFPKIRLHARSHTPLAEVTATLLSTYRRRTAVGLSLMTAQAFFYNAIFFTYALILIDFYKVPSDDIGWYLLPFAAGNFLGPLVLGRLFDTIGRRQMIAFTYAISGVLLAATGSLFARDFLTAGTLTLAWMVIFFFASAAASAAYLTVSETFRWRFAPSRSRSSMLSARASVVSWDLGCLACSSRPAHVLACLAAI